MSRQILSSRKNPRRSEQPLLPVMSELESRLLLSGHGHTKVAPPPHKQLPAVHVDRVPRRLSLATSTSTATTPTASMGLTYPLSSLPILHSNPGAPATLFLDLDGAPATKWGSYSASATRAYTYDTDYTTFSDQELTFIRGIWARVAEEYSPFNLDVTTQDPGTYPLGKVLRVVIGDNGAWYGGGAAGVCYADGFANGPNTAWVFSDGVAGSPEFVAHFTAHEAGHGFGLRHQSLYDSTGKKLYEYSPGVPGRGPTMGGPSLTTQRALWWYGTNTISATTYQDDMALIARAQNGFGYRADDHGDVPSTAAPLAGSGNLVSGSGIIEKTTDSDVFSFTTAAGSLSLSAGVFSAPDIVGGGPMLDLKLQLLDASGNVIASADTSSFLRDENITTTVPAGTYYVAVSSHGSYGDVGQYTISGTIVVPSNFIAAPSSMTATPVSVTQINLAWTDNSSNEDGFKVQRSADNGSTWIDLATLAANSVSFQDVSASPGIVYQYRVSAYNPSASSSPSNTASAVTIPPAPASASAAAASSTEIDVTWSDVVGESAFVVQRSADATAWSQIASVLAGTTKFQDRGLPMGAKYYYRVLATNSIGESAPSPTASATTPVPLLPAAPSNLVATALGKGKIKLTWTDNANNETGFYVERSLNGTTFSKIASLAGNAVTYTDSGRKKGSTWFYRVRAYNASGYSIYSNTVSVVAI